MGGRKCDKMTDKEIKALARSRIISNGGDCISLTVYLFAFITFFLLSEALCYVLLKFTGHEWLYDITLIFKSKSVSSFWIAKSCIEVALLIPHITIMRRYFLDIARGNSMTDTCLYISTHASSYYKMSYKSFLIRSFLKITVAIPGFVSTYGIYYWSYVCRIDTLTSAGLYCLMLCVGFTVIWVGMTGHYYISLCLTPYIMALNPRTNIFDACDLSVRLMDGKHYRYLKFLAGFIKFIPTLLAVYPVFVIFPYFKVSYTLLMDEFLGEYSHDKIPGMIKRWRKHCS